MEMDVSVYYDFQSCTGCVILVDLMNSVNFLFLRLNSGACTHFMVILGTCPMAAEDVGDLIK